MISHFLDKFAAKISVEVVVTPVGFKCIGEVMMNNPDKFLIGREESGGLTIRGHVPEKDGILACLLMAEATAMSKKSVASLLKDIKKLVGETLTSRLDFCLPSEIMDIFRTTLETKHPKSIAGMRVQKSITVDGHKFILDDSTWIGFRLSGTEALVRIYRRDIIYGK